MKKMIRQSLCGTVAAVATMLLLASSAQATTWNFSGSPLQGGWKYDTSSRPGGGRNTRFAVQFVPSYVSTSGGKLINRSDPMKNGGTANGGGIRKTGVFNSMTEGRCRAASNNRDEVRRSQASLWLHPDGRDTMEIDFYEIKPDGNKLNFIPWRNGRNSNIGKANHFWGAIRDYSTVQEWANYKCTVNGARTKFDCFRNNKRFSYNVPSGLNVGTEIVAHNKPWRRGTGIPVGPTASMECDWIRN